MARAARILALLPVLAALVPAPGAQAAFPGSNGRIAFATAANGIELINPGGTGRSVVPNTAGGRRPAWSPDGQWIAFQAAGIWVVRPDGSDLRNVSPDGQTPNWSPDGNRLVFHAVADGNLEIFTVRFSDGGDRQRLTTNGAADREAAWSPNGARIAFVSNRSGDNQLWTIPAAGGEALQLTKVGNVGDRPSWHPSGSRIAYVVDPGSFVDIFVTDAGGEEDTRVTFAGNEFAQSPAFSPDGGRLTYRRAGALWTDGAGGGAEVEIPNTTGGLEPDWEPVGCTTKLTVGNAVAEGCFTPMAGQPGDFVTTDPAYVGGFDIRPADGGALVLHTAASAPSLAAGGAGVSVLFDGQTTLLPVDLLPVAAGSAEIDLSGATGSVIAALWKVPLVGKLKVTWTEGGTGATIEGAVKVLDGLLPPTIGAVVGDDLEAEFAATLGNGKGIEVQSAKVTVPPLGLLTSAPYVPAPGGSTPRIGFSGGVFKFTLIDGKPQFIVSGGLAFPVGASRVLSFAPTFAIFDGQLAGFGLELGGLNTPLFDTGLFLQSVSGLGLWNPRFGLDLGAKATLGPQPPGSPDPLLKLEGHLRTLDLVNLCPGSWSELSMKSNIPILERLDIGKGEIEGALCLQPGLGESWTLNGTFKVGLKLGSGADAIENGVGADGTIGGAINGQGAFLSVDGKIRLPAPAAAVAPNGGQLLDLQVPGKGIVSTTGYAFCADLGFFSAGFGAQWNQDTDFFRGCDVSPFRPPAAPSVAAAGARALTVPKGLPFAGIAAIARNGAPRVRITGPGGVRIVTGKKFVRRKNLVVYPVPVLNRTYVFVRKPSAGTWRVTPIKGDKLARIEFARGLRKPKIAARIRGTGNRRKLSYTLRRVPGQKVQFAETTASGGVHLIGKPTNRAKGTIRFRPPAGPVRRRIVQAIVTQNKLPRATLKVARYRAPAPTG